MACSIGTIRSRNEMLAEEREERSFHDKDMKQCSR